jgi:hypothetical protein
MQHLNRYGYKSFPEQGISLAGEEFDQSTPFFLSHGGDGTAIVLFYDTRVIGGNFVARTLLQRVDSTGRLLWGDRGISLSSTTVTQRPTALLPDESGGAFVFWAEDRDGDGIQEMFGNRIAANGQSLWGKDGKKIAAYENNEIRTQAVIDLNGGFFVAYEKKIDLYVHHLNGNGDFLWPEPVKMPIGIWGVLAGDNAGGFFWTAHEQIGYRPPAGIIYRTRVFRYGHDGKSLWPTEGIAITDSAYGQTFAPEIIVDDQQDVAIIYRGLSKTTTDNVFVQRINFMGGILLEYGGRPLSIYPSTKAINQTCPRTNGNVFVVWWDGRVPQGDLYGQAFAQSAIFSTDIVISSRAEVQRNHRVCSDGRDGCIVTWYELGLGSGWGIFAQQVSRNGKLAEIITTSVIPDQVKQPSITSPVSFAVFPNPFSGSTQFRVTFPFGIPIRLQIFDVTGKVVHEYDAGPEKGQTLNVTWNGRDQEGRPLPSGIYLVKVGTGHEVAIQEIVLIK